MDGSIGIECIFSMKSRFSVDMGNGVKNASANCQLACPQTPRVFSQTHQCVACS